MSFVLRNFLRRKHLKIEITSKKNPLCLRVYCDGECICEHNTENKGKSTENIYNQKPV